MGSAQELITKFENFYDILIKTATNGYDTAAFRSARDKYTQLRIDLLSNEELRSKMPAFVQKCPTLDDFSQFVRQKNGSTERRSYLKTEFEPARSFIFGADTRRSTEPETSKLMIGTDDILLEEGQKDLLCILVEMALKMPRDKREFRYHRYQNGFFIADYFDKNHKAAIESDYILLEGAGLLQKLRGSKFFITPKGFEYYQKYTHEFINKDLSERIVDVGGNSMKGIFIIHGHDKASLTNLQLVLHKIGAEPKTFEDLPKRGSQTIIEILEEHIPHFDAVIALLTPDDEGRERGAVPLVLRARENVLVEAGYGLIFRRERSLLIALGGVSIPSDFDGIHRVQDDEWSFETGFEVARRLAEMGLDVDSSKI